MLRVAKLIELIASPIWEKEEEAFWNFSKISLLIEELVSFEESIEEEVNFGSGTSRCLIFIVRL